MSDELDYTVDDLATAAGVPTRTVRYYLTEGLLPGPGKRGRGAQFTGEHLRRLRLIRLLVERRVPLSEVRTQLAGLDDVDVRRLLEREEGQARRLQADAAASPRAYVASLLREADLAVQHPHGVAAPAPLVAPSRPAAAPSRPPPAAAPPIAGHPAAEPWLRWPLAPGLELHVRRDMVDRYRRLIDHIVAIVRERRPSGP